MLTPLSGRCSIVQVSKRLSIGWIVWLTVHCHFVDLNAALDRDIRYSCLINNVLHTAWPYILIYVLDRQINGGQIIWYATHLGDGVIGICHVRSHQTSWLLVIYNPLLDRWQSFFSGLFILLKLILLYIIGLKINITTDYIICISWESMLGWLIQSYSIITY